MAMAQQHILAIRLAWQSIVRFGTFMLQMTEMVQSEE